jgi:F-type H+-transporting ATPase subunit gamma
MAKMREIKGRIRAVGNIQRITKTMQMIATARFQAAVRRASASRPYAEEIDRLAAHLGAAAGSIDHPLLRQPGASGGRELLLVITSNRGLCGAYNSNVLRTASDYVRCREAHSTDIEVVGKKGQAYFRFKQVPVMAYHSQFSDRPEFSEVQALADDYIRRFGEGVYSAVKVVHMAFETVARQQPAVLTLLPLARPSGEGQGGGVPQREGVQYDFSPDPAQMMAELLPMTAKVRLLQAFNQAVVGEQVARMRAMRSATDAAGDMRRRLSRQFNRARQTAITTELSEIIGGSAALA